MKKIIAALTLPLMLAACQSTGEEVAMATISAQDLQHHNWELTQIDGVDIVTPKNMLPPRLEISEKMTANGNAGCNNFFGQGELKDDHFRIDKMGMTMKMCIGDVMKTEAAFSSTLSDWSKMTLTKDAMTLSNDKHTLTFKLRDWMQ